MQIKKLLNDDDAVSPVIGVILMVAITVILAAVIASFVLGLGDQAANSSPSASFNFDYDSSVTSDNLEVSHNGGDTIESDDIVFRGSNIDEDGDTWSTVANGGTNTDVSSGSTALLTANNDQWTVNVVYENPSGDSSSTLASDEGPGA